MASEEKSKQVFCQNEHGKFENKTANVEVDPDIEQLRRENQELKEKLQAIQDQSASEAHAAPKCAAAEPKTANAKGKMSASCEDLTAETKEGRSSRGRSPVRSNSCRTPYGPEKYWNWYGSQDLPCEYNPYCYSKYAGGPCDCVSHPVNDEYLADMLYRYPDYFGTRDNFWSARARAKSYDDINRILEVNSLYDNNYPPRRWRPRTRSMEPSAIVHPAVSVQSPVWDPYFTSWKYSGGPRIPFRPRSVWDLCVGMKVSMHRSDGRLSRGTIRWIGLLPNLVGEYVGVELETQTGRHDGYLNGVRYFKCKEKCGIFVKFSKIIMAWR